MLPDAYMFTVRREFKGNVTCESFAAIDFFTNWDETVTILKKEPLYLLEDEDTLPSTNESQLRAMANNYGDGPHLWDKLDKEVCLKAADEIKTLHTIIDILRKNNKKE